MLKNRITMRFFCFYILFATHKPRRSVYTSTPSGGPKVKTLARFVCSEAFFPIPTKRESVKN